VVPRGVIVDQKRMDLAIARKLATCCTCVILLAACGANGTAHTLPNPTPAWAAVDIAGMPGGFRGAVYDPSRDCLWIVSRYFKDAGAEGVRLLRLNVADKNTFRTSVDLPADGFIKGLVAVDHAGKVWMAWGRTLIEYDPGTEATRSWTRPPYTGLWQADDAGLYGNMVGLAIDPGGEVWLASYEVSAVFGFNPVTTSWDRTVNLPFLPTDEITLAVAAPGILAVSGVTADGKFTPELALVTTSTRAVKMVPTHGTDYQLTGSDQAVYVDHEGNLGELSLTDGTSTILAPALPIFRNPTAHLTVDSSGNIWFSMAAFRSVGVAMLDTSTGVITRFPFPYIDRPGQASTTPNTCPTGAFDCIPPDAVFDASTDALAFDSHGDLWVITEVGGHTDPTSLAIPSPIYELTNVA
jgi:streptogramin lyase